MTTSIWQRPSSLRVDVAVVGGGIIGTSTAWALRQLAPDLRVALVDAEHLAHGASGRNAGFLLLGTSSNYASAVDTCGRDRARRIWAFTHEAYALVQEVAERHDIGFRLTGSLIAAGSAGEADRLRQSHALLAEDGIDSVLHDPDETTSRFGVHGFPTSLFVPTGGVVDPARLVRALASESDAQVIERTRIARVELDGTSVRLSASSGSSVVADRVLLALNAG
ncbi:MAG: FAD-dependent oxidoreductase, partial [Bacteroidota bacterium]